MSDTLEKSSPRADFGEPVSLVGPGGAGRRTVCIAVGILAFFLVLEFITSLGLVPSIYLPKASTVLRRMGELLVDVPFLKHVLATLAAWAAGLALAILISVPIGILIGTSDLAYKMSSPVIEFMRPIPSVALIPLGILLWGQGFSMKVILVAYATTWPILFNTVYGVHDVDPIAVQTARCFGLKQAAILRRVSLPSAAPFIFTGIRISASIGLIVVIKRNGNLGDTPIHDFIRNANRASII